LKRVLFLELLEPLRVLGLHVPVLVAPAVPGRLGDLEVSCDFFDVLALDEQLLAFLEQANDLLG
jgi:hypothetical protein